MATRVVFDHVWKKFRRGERHDSLRDLIPSMMGRLTKRSREILTTEEFWAVENVTFEVGEGQALGIIGPNGAGKSTSLKLLTRILRANRGRCHVEGRVGALVEVAAGFHPDLTGRENVFLQGAIMGMSRLEILKRFDEIVEFSGVAPFIDTPIKRYSSGMNARLGFSIAAHLDPDVLIIDEVLSVGDVGFQQRCVDRMFEFKRQGVAIVFVSHNLQAVANLCDCVLVLRRKPLFIGDTAHGINTYVRSLEEAEHGGTRVTIGSSLTNATAGPVEVVRPGDRLVFHARYQAVESVGDFVLSFRVVRSTDQLLVYDGHFPGATFGRTSLAPGECLAVDFTFAAHLTRGQYHLETHIFEFQSQSHLAWLRPAAILTVDEQQTWGGVADLEVDTRVVSHEDAESPAHRVQADAARSRQAR